LIDKTEIIGRVVRNPIEYRFLLLTHVYHDVTDPTVINRYRQLRSVPYEIFLYVRTGRAVTHGFAAGMNN